MAIELIDGFVSLLDGMNAGIEPQLIKKTAYALGVNTTSRGGLIQTRPGFDLVAYLQGVNYYGSSRWSLEGREYLVYVTDGDVHVLHLDNLADTVVASGLVGHSYFCQVDKWMVVQDGTSRPVVIEESGGTFTVSRNPTDVLNVRLVPGTIGAYVNSHYHYVPTWVPMLQDTDGDGIPDNSTETGRTCFVSSDTRIEVDPKSVFGMEETMVVGEGPAMGLPSESGFIYGMAALRNANTGTGVGPLIVFGREGVSAFDVSIPARDEWYKTSISQVAFSGIGTRSHRAVQSVNGDIMFLDTDGNIRSFKYSASSAQGALVCVPMSYELAPYISRTNLDLASMSNVDGRVLTTFSGQDNYFRAMASLDLAPIYSIAGAPSPLYDGLWTGFKILQVLSARRNNVLTHMVVIKKDDGSGVALVELNPNATSDLGTPIESQLVTRVMNADNGDLKRLKYCELWFSGIKRTTSVEILYRPEGHSLWFSSGTKTINVPTNANYEHVRRRFRFSIDFSTALCDTVENRKACMADGFQLLIRWVGSAKIERCRIVMDPEAEAPNMCVEDNADDHDYQNGEPLDPYSYEVAI